MTNINFLAVAALVPTATSGFVPSTSSSGLSCVNSPVKPITFAARRAPLFAEVEEGAASEAVFIPEESEEKVDDSLEKAELLGKGAAKVSFVI